MGHQSQHFCHLYSSPGQRHYIYTGRQAQYRQAAHYGRAVWIAFNTLWTLHCLSRHQQIFCYTTPALFRPGPARCPGMDILSPGAPAEEAQTNTNGHSCSIRCAQNQRHVQNMVFINSRSQPIEGTIPIKSGFYICGTIPIWTEDGLSFMDPTRERM